MNILVKSAVAGALALGATGAFALGVPNQGSTDLVLVVENLTTQATYALDTNIPLSSVLPTGSLVSGAILNTSLAGITTTIDASPALQTFMAANPAAGDGWTIEGGQWNGGAGGTATNANTKAPGAGLVVFSSNIGTANNATLSNQKLTNLDTFLTGFQGSVGQSNGGLFPLLSSTETTAAAWTSDQAEVSATTKYGMIGAPDINNADGSAYQLFGFTGNGGTNTLQSYILGTASLDVNGNLTLTGNTTSAVPLPAAVWLFGSGLMGLVGVSRRRKIAVADAV